MHVPDVRTKGKLTRFQFFIIVSVTSFAYYIVPNFLFPSVTALSIVGWIWKDSVTAHQIGSGTRGLGLGSFLLDYPTLTTYVGSPFTAPPLVIVNTMIGLVSSLYLVIPISYWLNFQNSKWFPLFSSHLFDSDGHQYNVSRVLDERGFTLDREKYKKYSKVYLSTLNAYSYGFGYALSAAVLTHTVLYHGR